MRFLHFDRVISIEPGKRIETVACTSLKDEYLRGHFDARPLVPGTVVLEAMLQSLGWLVIRSHDFRVLPLFSMLEDCSLPADLSPGDRIDLVGELLSTNPQGSMGRATASIAGREIASLARVLYGHYPAKDPAALRETFRCYGGSA